MSYLNEKKIELFWLASCVGRAPRTAEDPSASSTEGLEPGSRVIPSHEPRSYCLVRKVEWCDERPEEARQNDAGDQMDDWLCNAFAKTR